MPTATRCSCPPGDADALAAAIGRVLGDPALARSLVASGDARAAEFSLDHLAEVYLGLYGRAIAHDRARA